jgi:hypothetical protein
VVVARQGQNEPKPTAPTENSLGFNLNECGSLAWQKNVRIAIADPVFLTPRPRLLPLHLSTIANSFETPIDARSEPPRPAAPAAMQFAAARRRGVQLWYNKPP